MLKPPHTRYCRIYTYHIDGTGLPVFNDPDLIGIWEEDGKTILIFHTAKDHLVQELCRQNSCRLFYQADLDYDDWEMGRAVVPFTVGPLTVAPLWASESADIKIDPSVVFGNGFHPSQNSQRALPGWTWGAVQGCSELLLPGWGPLL
jgi:ribosomal protein L11 methyltransferase